MKYILIFIVNLFIINLSYAVTCPSVEDLKNNNLLQWQALNINTRQLLTESELIQFEKNVKEFILASWEPGDEESTCYYNEMNPESVNAFLLRRDLVPNESVGNWRYVDRDYMTCDAGISLCQFNYQLSH